MAEKIKELHVGRLSLLSIPIGEENLASLDSREAAALQVSQGDELTFTLTHRGEVYAHGRQTTRIEAHHDQGIAEAKTTVGLDRKFAVPLELMRAFEAEPGDHLTFDFLEDESIRVRIVPKGFSPKLAQEITEGRRAIIQHLREYLTSPTPESVITALNCLHPFHLYFQQESLPYSSLLTLKNLNSHFLCNGILCALQPFPVGKE